MTASASCRRIDRRQVQHRRPGLFLGCVVLGQVDAHREGDQRALRRHHDEAVRRVEADQERHGGDELSRRTDLLLFHAGSLAQSGPPPSAKTGACG